MVNKGRFYPRILVFFQFFSLFFIMFSGPIFPGGLILSGIQAFAVFLGFWAVFTMRIGHFNITPIPVKNAVLVESGPYKVVRHPMYLSIFLFVIPELIGGFSTIRLLFFIMLLVTIGFKVSYEEKQLQIKLNGYTDYIKRSFRVIPFLY